MAERPLPKPKTRVRFPSSAPIEKAAQKRLFLLEQMTPYEHGSYSERGFASCGAGTVSACETSARRKDIRRRRNTRQFLHSSIIEKPLIGGFSAESVFILKSQAFSGMLRSHASVSILP